MAKGKGTGKVAPKATVDSGKTIQRKRRNSFQRKCLPKQYKVLFAGYSRLQFKELLLAWEDGRKRVHSKED